MSKSLDTILTNGKSLRNENGYNILKAGIDELSINIYEGKN